MFAQDCLMLTAETEGAYCSQHPERMLLKSTVVPLPFRAYQWSSARFPTWIKTQRGFGYNLIVMNISKSSALWSLHVLLDRWEWREL